MPPALYSDAMFITPKTPAAIEKMRIAGKLAADVLITLEPWVRPGITTDELNRICHQHITEVQQAIPAPLNYRGFPKSICASTNHVVCHGVPNDRLLKEGDIVNVDVTVIKDGYHGDTSKMYAVGKIPAHAQRLVRVTQECLYLGISAVKPGGYLGDIAAIIQSYAEKNHYSIVREYCGHGIGTVFHEPEIQVLHYGKPGTGERLIPGMTFTIEPMLNAGKRYIKLLQDGWTVITKDRRLSAQWEHTIAVTETGYEVLTLRPEENIQQAIAALSRS